MTERKFKVNSSTIAVGCLIALVAFILIAGCSRQIVKAASTSDNEPASSNAREQTALIHQGKLIFDETPKYASKYVGNKLSCNDCHIKDGTAPYAAPMIDLAGLFPMFNKRAGHVISLKNRLQECFSRSEAGSPPPSSTVPNLDCRFVTHINFLSRDEVKGKPSPWRALVKLSRIIIRETLLMASRSMPTNKGRLPLNTAGAVKFIAWRSGGRNPL